MAQPHSLKYDETGPSNSPFPAKHSYHPSMKILILGATGFIGSAILMRLATEGHAVTGLARNITHAREKWPAVEWRKGDLAGMTAPADWQSLMIAHDAIVNCAGALQDGLSDNLAATQQQAMLALYDAAASTGGRLIVQISAQTTGNASTLPFLKTKRHADEALAASTLPHVILRPALVIGRNAHGGTALLRALAALPFIVPLIHAHNPVKIVALDDVAKAVSMAINGEIPSSSDIDLAAGENHTLETLVQLHRHWLGLPAARTVTVPPALARPVTWAADLAGQLGWRSPLRSTAMSVMSEGVGTESAAARQIDGLRLKTAHQTLDAQPSGIQDLWFARLYLLKPAIILILSLFWLLSGLIPLLAPTRAAVHFSPFIPETAALALTLASCALDVLLGLSVLVRPFAAKALIGMLITTAGYLTGGTLLEPGLWLDPLGPLVKTLPSAMLALVALAILKER
jgi:uncharacterized protein YbjT (DUF2867 family)